MRLSLDICDLIVNNCDVFNHNDIDKHYKKKTKPIHSRDPMTGQFYKFQVNQGECSGYIAMCNRQIWCYSPDRRSLSKKKSVRDKF